MLADGGPSVRHTLGFEAAVSSHRLRAQESGHRLRAVGRAMALSADLERGRITKTDPSQNVDRPHWQ